MPDISMCTGGACRRKMTCYRYMAKPDEYQSYMEFYADGPACAYYAPIMGREVRDEEAEPDEQGL